MAASHSTTQPAFLIFPTLSPEYTWKIVATETNRTISRHKLLENAVAKAERQNVRALSAVTPSCSFEDSRYEFACGKKAVVSDIDSQEELCAKHGEVVCG